jgi:hypothetical protein
VEADPNAILPKDHKVNNKANEISLPYTEHFKDPDEEESFKIIAELEIKNQGSGYTCFVQSYALFIADREVKVGKSSSVKVFEGINSIEKFEALGLPIKKISKCSDGTNNVAYEIDLSQGKKL